MAIAELFERKTIDKAPETPVQETEIWKILGMDKLTDQMTEEGMSNQNPIFMGTGYTHNACNMCTNTLSKGCFPTPTCF